MSNMRRPSAAILINAAIAMGFFRDIAGIIMLLQAQATLICFDSRRLAYYRYAAPPHGAASPGFQMMTLSRRRGTIG